MRYTASYARPHLSRLLRQAEASEDVIIMRRNKPIARIVPLDGSKSEGQSSPDSAKDDKSSDGLGGSASKDE